MIFHAWPVLSEAEDLRENTLHRPVTHYGGVLQRLLDLVEILGELGLDVQRSGD